MNENRLEAFSDGVLGDLNVIILYKVTRSLGCATLFRL